MNPLVPVESAINARNLPPGSRIYVGGNAATPQVLLQRLVQDQSIRGVEMYSLLPIGEEKVMKALFDERTCERVTHRVIFNSAYSREAVNAGRAKYQLWHLSEIPAHLRYDVRPNVVLLQVSGPDRGGNYSLGTTVEALLEAIETTRRQGGLVIAERNRQMPFVLGTSIPGDSIDHLVDVDYPLPVSHVRPPDERARRIGRIIAQRYVDDGSTLQYGIGEVPEAVTEAIIQKGVKDLGIHTELFADAMRDLVQRGLITNRNEADLQLGERFSVASLFLASDQQGYQWMDGNSSIQSRPCDFTNSILTIAKQPKLVAINSAIGVDLHGNIWADSLKARSIYGGIGGQADFLRGAQYSRGGRAVIALKATTRTGASKIVDMCPEGITTTAIAADNVHIVTEYGAFDPHGLSIGEHAVAIAHLAAPELRDQLLKRIYDNPAFHRPRMSFFKYPKGFLPYEAI